MIEDDHIAATLHEIHHWADLYVTRTCVHYLYDPGALRWCVACPHRGPMCAHCADAHRATPDECTATAFPTCFGCGTDDGPLWEVPFIRDFPLLRLYCEAIDGANTEHHNVEVTMIGALFCTACCDEATAEFN